MALPEKSANLDEYNGWRNYESWAVFTWIGNDPMSYNTARSLAFSDNPEENLRDWVDIAWLRGENVNASLRSDLLGHSLDRVDWRRVVEALRE
jgi:hypothetical protein